MKKSLGVRRSGRLAGVIALALAVLAATASLALAANLSGDGTIIGTTGADNITAHNGNDTIWGLGGSDNINVGSGNDVIDAGGVCPAGVNSGVYPNGYPASSYCQHGPGGPAGTDNIDVSGNGNDTVYGNSGLNTVNLGNGNDTVYAWGLKGNNINVGNGNDTIYAYYTGNYDVGSGTNTIYAQYTRGATINCATKKTTVYAVKGADNISTNCTVVYESAQTPPSSHLKVHKKVHAKHQAKKHHKRHR